LAGITIRGTEINIKKIRIGKKTYPTDLSDMEIDHKNLSKEMTRQPSLYAWYGVMHSIAKKYMNDIILKKECLNAELDKYYREQCEKDEVKITEKLIASMIRDDKDYQEIKEEIAKASFNVDLLGTAMTALSQRKDMLQAAGALMRAELDSGLNIKEKLTRKKKTRN